MTIATDLLDRARTATSLDDFGESSFREGLEILVAALDSEARLTDAGRAAIHGQIVDFLVQRLHVEDWYRRHPEIDAQEIVAPLIGLGLPRTGSTALSCLLAADPAARPLRTWEASAPCPPPETATEHNDPRIAATRQRIAYQAQVFPRMQTMLPQTAEGPIECQSLMGHDFKSQFFFAMADVPSYRHWLCHEADLVPTYAYVKRVLKLLQWRCPPRRWRIKNPSHAMFIDALVTVFPDARFWMTHRDIAAVIPSVSDLYVDMMGAFSDRLDKPAIGRINGDFWELAMRRMIAFRDAGQDHRFFDIHFAPLMRDPIGEVAALYRFLGEDFTPEARAAMDAWRRDTPREKHGAHGYDAADFGLHTDDLRRRFGFYTERFGVAA